METEIKDNYMENYDIYTATVTQRCHKKGKFIANMKSKTEREEIVDALVRLDGTLADKEIR